MGNDVLSFSIKRLISRKEVSMGNAPIQLQTPRGSFRVQVDGDATAPALILSNSLGTTLDMWSPQIATLSQQWRVIRYDTRGHGGSPITPGPYCFEDLGQDVLSILDALKVDTAAFCGISMGGHTGLWLGIHAPSRLSHVIVCNSSARIGTEEAWRDRAHIIRTQGKSSMQTLANTAPSRWFSDAFVQAQPEVVRHMQEDLAQINPEGYAACCEALATSDLRSDLSRITTPTLLIAGEYDPVTTVADAQAMHAQIHHADIAVLPASHISNIEAAQAFTDTVKHFLTKN
jgi:3-oxoadipate enol-lactonase